MGKFNEFNGYSFISKAYKVYNHRLQKVIERCDVKVMKGSEKNQNSVSDTLEYKISLYLLQIKV